MCGRYTLHADTEQIIRRFLLDRVPRKLPRRYNIAPSQFIEVVRVRDGKRELTPMRWGLIPRWAKDPAVGYKMINARAETLATKPAFRSALREHRCIVPADGFYEWRQERGGKTPMYFRRRDGEPFAFAGLWESWASPEGEKIETSTIVTTEANELVSPLHDRMPVILRPDDEAAWLDPECCDPQNLLPLLRPLPADEMMAHPVSPRVNSPKTDERACVEPVPDARAAGTPTLF